MANAQPEFALVGYAEDLERRPLKFVDPIPVARICNACGHIPRRTYTLLCGHIFCEPCYQCCATTSGSVCPLDGDACVTADVSSKEYPAESLLSRKVHCWNESNGCGVILPASRVAEHVRHDCQHHVTRCPNCSATVLSRDACAHLKSRCTALVLDAAFAVQPRGNDTERTHLETCEEKVEQRVRVLDGKLAQLSLKCDSLSDKLVEICHSNNHLKETLSEQLETISVRTLDRLGSNGKMTEERLGVLHAELAQLSVETCSISGTLVEIRQNINHFKQEQMEKFGSLLDHKLAEMKAFYTENFESLSAVLMSALTPVPSDLKTHQRVITGYARLKQKALIENSCDSWSDKVYLCRYLMSWGIAFEEECDTVNLYLQIQLHEGREDDFLEWPFAKKVKLTIIHPDTRQELVREGIEISFRSYREFFCRPTERSNQPVIFISTEVDSSDLERGGYVKNDKLLLRIEVLE